MTIISVPSGNFTPGAQFSINSIAAVINAAWEQGNSKANSFSAKLDAITDEATGWLSTQAAPSISAGTVAATGLTPAELTAPTAVEAVAVDAPAAVGVVDAPTILEPAVTIPASQSAGDVIDLFDSKYLELVALLSDKFTAFRTTYFPDEATAYTAAEDWLQAAIANPDSALPPTVAAQIVTDDRDRILSDAARASDTVLAQFAARRFPLPPGAAAAATLEIQNKAQDEIAATWRKVALASIEQMRFVIQQVMGLRQSAMDSAIKYITALASGPEMASRLVGIGYDAQSKLISAASQFYNSRITAAEVVAKTQQFNVTKALQEEELAAKVGQFNVSTELDAGFKNAELTTKVQQFNVTSGLQGAELVSKVGQFNVSSALTAAEKNQSAEMTLIEDRLKALLTECQAIAQMATSLFNNIHASAGTSYNVSP